MACLDGGYGEAINKEVEPVKEKRIEMRSEETAKEQIILDGKETESVSEEPVETNSDEVTKEQNGSE